MARSGDHRIRHLARWVATPLLMLAGALVAFAVYEREVSLLITAAVGALAAGVIAVVVFDIELIRARRAHGADRVAQARAYAAMYAAHVRVMAEGFALAEQRRRAAEEQASEQASPDESTTEASTESTSPSVASQLEPVVLAMATAGMAEDAATGRPSEADPAGQAATSRPTLVEPSHPRLVEAEATSAAEVGVPDTDPEPVARREDETEHVAIPIRMPVAADDDDAADLWDTFDAPTVVDLMAWEVRARLAAEEERERQARSTGGAEPTNESPASAAGA